MIPRRSVLYLPGSNERALEKAQKLACDAIIFDLEDAVAPSSKELARDAVRAALNGGDYGHREQILRVNALDTPWGQEDVQLAASLPIDAVLFPKVDSASAVDKLVAALDAAGATSIPIWLMIETPQSILNVAEIAAASKRVEAIVLGTSDLVKELRARHTAQRDNLAYALQACVVAARAADIDVLDGVHLDFRNLDTFRAACESGLDMGFDGKTLIHPSQIDIANIVFGIADDALARAERVLEVWREAQSNGAGVAELDGQLIENLHAADAERTLEFAAAIARRTLTN